MKNISTFIPIIYSDDQLMVFDKPARLLVIPTPKGEEHTLTNIVNEQYALNQSWKLHPCHRLDRDTSGLIIYAKGKNNQQDMMNVFHEKKVVKKYIALVQGQLKKEKGEIKSKVLNLEKQHFSNTDGKMAVTHYQVLRQLKTFAIVLVEILTGRTNQIRIHFSDMGHALVGDRKYGRGRDFKTSLKRAALHAAFLQFVHPITGQTISLKSEIPEDINKFLVEQSVEVGCSLKEVF
ncbi:MAG: RluA family pseudouridine synthase [Candidatus Omnitrophica bacterium]|nr:RluA family pseudouridine synthase [Candidatus Omnitrophota bacterium]